MERPEKEVALMNKPKRKLNGWLFRWWHELVCGAVYGHEYVQVTPEVQGMIGCECKWCRKFKVI